MAAGRRVADGLCAIGQCRQPRVEQFLLGLLAVRLHEPAHPKCIQLSGHLLVDTLRENAYLHFHLPQQIDGFTADGTTR